MSELDYLVIGGGIAGVSAASELAAHGRVRLLERESALGYHSTGRSAALYAKAYGNPTVRALTRASGPFFRSPPAGFAEHPLLQPRGTLFIAREEQLPALNALHDELRATGTEVVLVDGRTARALVPALRPDYARGGFRDLDAEDIDVELLLRGFARVLRSRGGEVVQSREVLNLEYRGHLWHVTTDQGTHAAKVVVNAAGAWADGIAAQAGVAPIGLVPKRRTACTFPPAPHADVRAWPAVIDVDEQFYFKPDAGNILASPADETPSPACDAMPEDLDVAIGVDRVQQATDFVVARVTRQWAGLRSFVADKSLVIGYDPVASGFFWLAAQGGYGIQTSPAAARAAAALATRSPWPDDLARQGLSPEALAPARLRR